MSSITRASPVLVLALVGATTPPAVANTFSPPGVTLSVRVGGEPCPWDEGCHVGITLTLAGEDAPVLKTIVSVSSGVTSTGGWLVDEVDAGRYVVMVSALGADLPESGSGPLDVHAGALATCWTTLALGAGQPSVDVTASMAWDRLSCEIEVGRRPPESPSP
jgi:hypothetical protein